MLGWDDFNNRNRTVQILSEKGEEKLRKRNNAGKKFVTLLLSLPMYLYCIGSLIFLSYALINPFKSNKEFFQNLLGLPRQWTLENIIQVWKEAEFYKYYVNSIVVTVCATLSILVIASLTAYGLSRYKFKFNKKVNSFFLLGMMFPATIMIIPLFLVARNLGLVDNFRGLVVIFTATTLSFSVFILAGFFKTLPHEVHEAAKIDGAGEFRIFWKIMMPMARPILGTLMTITAINVWNDYFISLIMIYDNDKRTLPLALANFYAGNQARWPLLFAALFITTLPIIIVFFIGSKQIVSGLTAGATK